MPKVLIPMPPRTPWGRFCGVAHNPTLLLLSFKFGLVVFIDRYITLHLIIGLIGVIPPIKPSPSTSYIKKESPNNRMIIKTLSYVGMTKLATTQT